MSIVKLLKLLEKKGCVIVGADMQMMGNVEKSHLEYDAKPTDYIIPYWNVKIQLPVDKKEKSE